LPATLEFPPAAFCGILAAFPIARSAVSEPVPCPTCQSLLRLPPGATAVRCPNCKTVLAVELADAPQPAPAAPPLPFGRPRPAIPLPPAPPPIPTAPPKRARLAPEEPRPRAEPNGESAEPDEEARRRQIRRELEELEAKELREQEWMEELAGHCKHGRTAMHFLTWGVRTYTLAILLQLVAVAAVGFSMIDYAALVIPLCLAFAGFTTLLLGIGFGFAIAGPEQGRHIGVMGLIICVIHAIGGILQPGNLVIMVHVQGLETAGRAAWDLIPVQDILGLATNLPLLADHPARFVQTYNWSLLGLVVAALEFTRLVLLAMLVQNYAVAGKDPEAGHRAFQTVNRIFWVVLLACSFRLAAAAVFDGVQEDVWSTIGATVHGAITFSCYFAVGIALLLFSQNMNDTVTLVDHRRFADKRERLEV
jgi:LSD1 subclass zinc finger protein